jgi:hypothetical protein
MTFLTKLWAKWQMLDSAAKTIIAALCASFVILQCPQCIGWLPKDQQNELTTAADWAWKGVILWAIFRTKTALAKLAAQDFVGNLPEGATLPPLSATETQVNWPPLPQGPLQPIAGAARTPATIAGAARTPAIKLPGEP